MISSRCIWSVDNSTSFVTVQTPQSGVLLLSSQVTVSILINLTLYMIQIAGDQNYAKLTTTAGVVGARLFLV